MNLHTLFPSTWPTNIQLYIQLMFTYFVIRLMLITNSSSPPEEREPAPLLIIKFSLAIGLMFCYAYQALNSGSD